MGRIITKNVLLGFNNGGGIDLKVKIGKNVTLSRKDEMFDVSIFKMPNSGFKLDWKRNFPNLDSRFMDSLIRFIGNNKRPLILGFNNDSSGDGMKIESCVIFVDFLISKGFSFLRR